MFDGKLMKKSLEQLLRRICRQPHDRNARMQQAITALLALISDDSVSPGHTGFLTDYDPDGDGPLKSSFVKNQNIANELGYVPLLLSFATEACRNAPSMSDAEDELAAAAYAVLGVLVKGNRDVAESVVESGGVNIMLKHLTWHRSPNSTWKPPLLELVDASYAASDDYAKPVDVLTEADLVFLLDEVSADLAMGCVPNSFTYQFLARVCRPGGSLLRGKRDADFINHKMQTMICRHILGTPVALSGSSSGGGAASAGGSGGFGGGISSPFWSLMAYRTFVDEMDPLPLDDEHEEAVEEELLFDKDKISKGVSFYGSHRPVRSIRSFKSVGEAVSGDKTDERPALPRRRLLVSTTPYGQIRPSTTKGKQNKSFISLIS